MIRVDFYHLQRAPLEQVLPKLCEKAYATGKRIKILLGTEERVEFINSLLWTYNEESFLPHGSKKDRFCPKNSLFLYRQMKIMPIMLSAYFADGLCPIQKR